MTDSLDATPISNSFVITWGSKSLNGLVSVAYVFCINKQNFTKEQLESIIIKAKDGDILKTIPIVSLTLPMQVISFENFIRPGDIVDFSPSAAANKCKLTKEEFEYVKSQWKDLQEFEIKLLKYAKLI